MALRRPNAPAALCRPGRLSFPTPPRPPANLTRPRAPRNPKNGLSPGLLSLQPSTRGARKPVFRLTVARAHVGTSDSHARRDSLRHRPPPPPPSGPPPAGRPHPVGGEQARVIHRKGWSLPVPSPWRPRETHSGVRTTASALSAQTGRGAPGTTPGRRPNRFVRTRGVGPCPNNHKVPRPASISQGFGRQVSIRLLTTPALTRPNGTRGGCCSSTLPPTAPSTCAHRSWPGCRVTATGRPDGGTPSPSSAPASSRCTAGPAAPTGTGCASSLVTSVIHNRRVGATA